MGIQQGIGPGTPAISGENLDQTAIGQLLLDNELVGLEQPRTVFSERDAAQDIVGAGIATVGEDLSLSALLTEQPRNPPPTAGQLELNALVSLQILKHLRCAGLGQIRRRGHHDQLGVFEQARDQRRIRLSPDPDRQIVPSATKSMFRLPR